jgi:hypothetical protein
VIPTNEELVMVEDVKALLEGKYDEHQRNAVFIPANRLSRPARQVSTKVCRSPLQLKGLLTTSLISKSLRTTDKRVLILYIESRGYIRANWLRVMPHESGTHFARCDLWEIVIYDGSRNIAT